MQILFCTIYAKFVNVECYGLRNERQANADSQIYIRKQLRQVAAKVRNLGLRFVNRVSALGFGLRTVSRGKMIL